jgi:hypothetical protein
MQLKHWETKWSKTNEAEASEHDSHSIHDEEANIDGRWRYH